jgi:Tfp pilus assembly protein PilF
LSPGKTLDIPSSQEKNGMSVRASVLTVVVLSLGLTCSSQVALSSNSSRFGATANNGINDITSGRVSGSVRSMDDHAVADARVELRSFNGEIVITGYTDARGTFNIDHVPPGGYEVVAMKGVNQAHERVQVAGMETSVDLRLASQDTVGNGGSSVSVAQFKVPEKARKVFEKGNEALQKNKLEDAKKYAEKALEIYPQFAEALTLRGILEINDGATDAGIADFDAAIKADPSYALAYTTMGAALNKSQRYDDATRSLTRAIALQPTAWQAYYELAKAYLGKGDYKTALRNVSKACEISQEYAPVHLVRAHALLGLKMYQDAVGELELYLTREPSGAAAEHARKTLDMAKSFVNVASK